MRSLSLISKIPKRLWSMRYRGFILKSAVAVAFFTVSLMLRPGNTQASAPPDFSLGFANTLERLVCPLDQPIGGMIADVVWSLNNPLPNTPDAGLNNYLSREYPGLSTGSFVQQYLDTARAQYTRFDNGVPVMIIDVENISNPGWIVTSFSACNYVLIEGAGPE